MNLDDLARQLRDAINDARFYSGVNSEDVEALLDERDELQAKVAEIREWAVSTLALDPPAWADSRVVDAWRAAASSVLVVLDKAQS